MKSDLQKFIFLAVIVGLATFHVQEGLQAGKSPKDAPQPAFAYNSLASPVYYSSGGTVSGQGQDHLDNLSGVVAPPQDLAFFRVQATPDPSISAEEAIVGDLRSGTIYFAAGSKMRWPLASLTKLMSAVLVSEQLKPDQTITLVPDDLVNGDNQYVNVFTPGSSYSVSDLLNAMLVGSSNESARALARTVGGDSFIDDMNKRATEWGLSETHFKDPAGISAANQSTAENVFKMVSTIYENYPAIFKITQNSKVTVTELNFKKKNVIQSTHNYAGRKDFLGGKTGTTPEAGENLATIISYGKREVVVIVLGASDRYKDTDQLIQWFKNDFSPGY